MKKILLLFMSFFMISVLSAQSCVPDSLYRDSAIGVYPPPFREDRPDGGITIPACINEPYEFTLTVKVPESITFGGFQVMIDSIVVETTGAVANLPEGMSYACNPPTCVLVPADTLSCIILFGTPTNAADVEIKDVTIDATVYTPVIAQMITLPDNSGTIPGADGNYFLEVREEGACEELSARDYLTERIQLRNSPNPFAYETIIEVTSLVTEILNFEVFDQIGKRVHTESVSILPGSNNIPFDAAHLNNGLYTYSLTNGTARVAGKMVVQR